MRRYNTAPLILVYLFIIINYFYIDTVDLGCPKLNDPPHGGYICADATKHENLNNYYEVRVCTPNCRTGFVANINNTILFCTSTSKVWRLLPEEYSLYDLRCIPTVNILYHNDEDRLQVRIQDFIEGKMPANLNSSYPKLLDNSNIKDALNLVNTNQQSDNKIKRQESIIGSDQSQAKASNVSVLNQGEDSLDYYSLKTDSSPDEFPNYIQSIINHDSNRLSKFQDEIIDEYDDKNNFQDKMSNSQVRANNKTLDSNKTQLIESNIHDEAKHSNSSLFQSPLSGLKYLIGTVASPKNLTKDSTDEKIDLTASISKYEPTSESFVTTTIHPTVQSPFTFTPRDDTNQISISPQSEWSNIELRFSDNSPIYNQQIIYEKQYNDNHLNENTIPLFDKVDNAHTRTNISEVMLPQLPNQLNIPPIPLDMTRLGRNHPPVITPLPIDYRTSTVTTTSLKTPHFSNQTHETLPINKSNLKADGHVRYREKNLIKGKIPRSAKKSIKNSKAKPKNNSVKMKKFINLVEKLKDGSVSIMNSSQRTKLVKLIKHKTKVTKKSFCDTFYPVCEIDTKKYNKRNIRFFDKKRKIRRLWTFPAT